MSQRNLSKFVGVIILLCCSTPFVFAQKKTPVQIEKLKSVIATVIVYDEEGHVLKVGDSFFLWPGVVIAKRDFLIGAYKVDIGTEDGIASPMQKIINENQSMNLVGLSVNPHMFEQIRQAQDSFFYKKDPLSLKQGEKVTLIGVSPETGVKIFNGKARLLREIPAFGKICEVSAKLPEEIDFYFLQNQLSELEGVVIVQRIDGKKVCIAFSFPQFGQLVNRNTQYRVWTLPEWNKKIQKNDLAEEDRINSNAAVLYSPAFPYLLIGDCEKAIPQLEDVINKYPNSSQAWLCLAHCLEKARLWEAAIDAYKSSLTLSADTAAQNALNRVYLKLGDAYVQIGNFSEAIKIYREVGAHEKIADTYFKWGDSSYQAGNYKEAEEIFQKLTSSKKRAETHYRIGLTYDRLGRYHEALTAFFTAVDLKPDFAEARYHLCLLFLTEGSKKNALKHYNVLKTLDKKLAQKVSVLLEK